MAARKPSGAQDKKPRKAPAKKKDPKRPLCGKPTAKGTACRRLVVPGTDSCEAHGRQPKRGGRPSKLTQEIINSIKQYLTDGNFISVTCKAVGINTDTFYEWTKLGLELVTEREQCETDKAPIPFLDSHERLLYQFAEAIEKAEALGEIGLLNNIKMGAPGWQGSAWIMQRRWRERWGDSRQADTDHDPLEEILADFRQQRELRQKVMGA